MKSLIKRYSYLAVLVFIISLVSGCSLFHRKKKCADCPKWNKIETPQTFQI